MTEQNDTAVNPYDLLQDVDVEWMGKEGPEGIAEASAANYDSDMDKCRIAFQKTREAIDYLRTLDEDTLTQAQRRESVETLSRWQRYTPEEVDGIEPDDYTLSYDPEMESAIEAAIPRIINKALEHDKQRETIPPGKTPETLDDVIAQVEGELASVPPLDFDTISDYLFIFHYVSPGHTLRRLAKHAWDVQHGIEH